MHINLVKNVIYASTYDFLFFPHNLLVCVCVYEEVEVLLNLNLEATRGRLTNEVAGRLYK